MAGDTALAELDNAEAIEATEEEALAESDQLAETESEEAAETETEEVEEDEPLSREDVDKLLKAERAKLEESFRQKSENTRKEAEESARSKAYKYRLTQAEQAQAGGVRQALFNGIAQIAKEVENGKEFGRDVSPNAQWLDGISNAVAQAAFLTQWAASEEHFESYVANEVPDWRPPRELVTKLRRAESAQDPASMFQARLAYMSAAIREQLAPAIRKEEQEKLKTQRTQSAKTAQIKDADTARAGQGRPTAALDYGSPSGTSLLTTAELGAFPAGAWSALSEKDKERIYANVEKADRAHGADTIRPSVRARWG